MKINQPVNTSDSQQGAFILAILVAITILLVAFLLFGSTAQLINLDLPYTV